MIRRPIEGGSEDEDDSGGYRPSVGSSGALSEEVGQKGKGKDVPGPKNFYTGDERCAACIRQKVPNCIVDRAVLEKWAAAWEAGRAGKKAPEKSSCQTCSKSRKRCELPATAAYRGEPLKRKREEDVGGSGLAATAAVAEGGEEPKAKRVKRSAEVEDNHPLEDVAINIANGIWAMVKELKLLNYHAVRIPGRHDQVLPRFLREEIRESEDESDPDFEYVSGSDSDD